MSNTRDRILQVMSNVFEISENELNEDSSTDTVQNWDSLKHLNLILALEDEFEISIPDEEVANLVNFKIIELTIDELTQ